VNLYQEDYQGIMDDDDENIADSSVDETESEAVENNNFGLMCKRPYEDQNYNSNEQPFGSK
jgi:hypothetical protein